MSRIRWVCVVIYYQAFGASSFGSDENLPKDKEGREVKMAWQVLESDQFKKTKTTPFLEERMGGWFLGGEERGEFTWRGGGLSHY